jgi:hypothetical protein
MIKSDNKKESGTCFGIDGKRYVVTGNKQIVHMMQMEKKHW